MMPRVCRSWGGRRFSLCNAMRRCSGEVNLTLLYRIRVVEHGVMNILRAKLCQLVISLTQPIVFSDDSREAHHAW